MAGENAANQARNRAELQKLGFHLQEVRRALGDGGQAGMRKVAEEGVSRIKALISHPGRSLPGQPPGLQTGQLRESYKWDEEKDGVKIYSDLDYSIYLELGTRYMAARPHVRPALYSMLPEMTQILGVEIEAKLQERLRG